MNNFFSIALMALLAGCAAHDDAAYPSLSPRPIETRLDEQTTPQPQGQLTTADPAFNQRLSSLSKSYDKSATALQSALLSISTDGRQAAPGSEAWVERQTALTQLQVKLAELREVQTDISALMAELAQARINGADTDALQNEARILDSKAEKLAISAEQALRRSGF